MRLDLEVLAHRPLSQWAKYSNHAQNANFSKKGRASNTKVTVEDAHIYRWRFRISKTSGMSYEAARAELHAAPMNKRNDSKDAFGKRNVTAVEGSMFRNIGGNEGRELNSNV